uniref:Premnaspirodiene oxygenase-like n=1 Tax=Nicotiana sylvestris TaxID=4096 RepID=A0A1U7WVI4_NICSY|nr:PREDICTED: premnaspirodiene oxygenase-like [Nicotiana sylvestris]
MVEMMKNPSILIKAQAEVRDAFKGKETFNENDVEELKYLKLVIKETFRLHPPLPLLIPRECREETNINGYTIPLKTTIMVNVWAMRRDPKYWVDAKSFKLERFQHSTMDFTGITPSDLDLAESAGLAVLRKSDFYLIATPYPPSSE